VTTKKPAAKKPAARKRKAPAKKSPAKKIAENKTIPAIKAKIKARFEGKKPEDALEDAIDLLVEASQVLSAVEHVVSDAVGILQHLKGGRIMSALDELRELPVEVSKLQKEVRDFKAVLLKK
jgi:hypothetical protein